MGHPNLEETIFKTNLERPRRPSRQQPRLRNLGGIIISDFIDVVGNRHQRQVLRTCPRKNAITPGSPSVS
ncbi:MAG: ribonuclease E/G [Proteobacteria bacterium]|nr:ribonuclease E/G [Pseudomonadota bacterium]